MNIPILIIGLLTTISVPAFISTESKANVALRKFIRLIGIAIIIISLIIRLIN